MQDTIPYARSPAVSPIFRRGARPCPDTWPWHLLRPGTHALRWTARGILSSFGTFLGGLVHVVAAAFGLSAVLAASAAAFTVVKYAGAAYLIWIGIGMIRSRNVAFDPQAAPAPQLHVFRQGVLTEMLNPKTALFFLSFLPQFVSPRLGHLVGQFLLLGICSVTLNTLADLVVVLCAAPLGTLLRGNPRFRRNQCVASGVGMIGLGAFVAFGERS